MSEFMGRNIAEANNDEANDYDELEEYSKEHPFDRQKAERIVEELKQRRDIMSSNLGLAEQVSNLRQSEPIRKGVRMEVAKIEAAAEEGLPGFADEDKLTRGTNRYNLIEKKRDNAISTQHNFENRKHELLMSTDDIETPTGMTIKEATDDSIGKAIWELQMEVNGAHDPDEKIRLLEKMMQIRNMRTKLASGVVDSVMDSIDKAQEMQDKIQGSTVKGIKAPEAPSLEETRKNQEELEMSQQEIYGALSDLDRKIADLEQKIQEDKNRESNEIVEM